MKFLMLFVAIFFAVPATIFAQNDFRRLSETEAAAVLDGFRGYRMRNGFCFKFNIEHYLRKSDESEFCTGKIFGQWDSNGPVFRIEIARATAPDQKKHYLLRGGKSPELWTLDAENRPVRIDSEATEPFFENLIFTPFDLQTPFVYWENAKYERTKRFRGRPVHFFKMFPPENFPKEKTDVGSVRIGFDRVYNALVSAEIFDANGKLEKTFSLSRVQKVQGEYTIRELSLRDDRTRDKDELTVYAVALNIIYPADMFTPAALSKEPPKIPESRFSVL